MAFKFTFMDGEYGPKKLALYSLPAISHVYRTYTSGFSAPRTALYLMGYCVGALCGVTKIRDLFIRGNIGYFDLVLCASPAIKQYLPKKLIQSQEVTRKCVLENVKKLTEVECDVLFNMPLRFASLGLWLRIDPNTTFPSIFPTALLDAVCDYDIASKKDEEIDLTEIAKYALCSTTSIYCASKVLGFGLHNAFGSKAAFFLEPLAGAVCSSVVFNSLRIAFLNKPKNSFDDALGIEEEKYTVKDIPGSALFSYKKALVVNTIIACGSYAISSIKGRFISYNEFH